MQVQNAVNRVGVVSGLENKVVNRGIANHEVAAFKLKENGPLRILT